MRGTDERAGESRIFSRRNLSSIGVIFVFWLAAIVASPAQTLTTLTTLAVFNGGNGAYPAEMALIQDSDGTFYGTTRYGGANNAGTVFKMSPAGLVTTLHSFCSQANCADGAHPFAGLVKASNGFFYGTTSSQGFTQNHLGGGTVFKIDSNGNLTTIYTFCTQVGCTDGLFPLAALVQSQTDGKLYGTAALGGADAPNGCSSSGCGVVFRIGVDGTGFAALYSFSGGADGGFPTAALMQRPADGNFYGTTEIGGNIGACQGGGCGTVFKVTPSGGRTTLYKFCPQGGNGCTDGQFPVSTLVQRSTDGNLYGTTHLGGGSGEGTVFQVTPAGVENLVYNFCTQHGCADGAEPLAGLLQLSDGTLIGTTDSGGANGNYGTIYQIPPAGTLTTVYSFCLQNGCEDGNSPDGVLVQGSDRNLYGVNTVGGGPNGYGTVFALSPTSANYTLTVSLTGNGTVTSTDGLIHCPGTCSQFYPNGTQVTLTAAPGSDSMFGGWSGGGCTGTGPCTVTVNQNLSVGAPFVQPSPILTVATDGSGTATSGDMPPTINCPGVCGYSYPVNTPVTLTAQPANGWIFDHWSGDCGGSGSCTVTMAQDKTVTAHFVQQGFMLSVSISGSGIVTSADGFINCPGVCNYTYPGGTPVTLNAEATQGNVFTGWSQPCSGNGSCMITMNSNVAVTATFSVSPQAVLMHSFGMGDGMNPTASLISDGAGNVYGTTPGGGALGLGRVFKLSSKGVETELYDFQLGIDGNTPQGSLIFDAAGNLYGTTYGGGYSAGTVFKLTPNNTGDWAETILYNFGAGADGQNPYAGLVMDATGSLYGTTVNGGSSAGCNNQSSCGTVFKLTPNPPPQLGYTETVLYSFGNGDDGKNPYAGLIFDASGNLYGTTVGGGTFGDGTVFELSPQSDGTWRETARYNFAGPDGANPYAKLILDSSGNLYGTTFNGGSNNLGMAFQLQPNGQGGFTEIGGYSFGGVMDGVMDGANPYSELSFDASGNLYGTTVNGGRYVGDNDGGTVFELSFTTAPTRCCREKMSYSLGGSNGNHRLNIGNGNYGRNPYAGVTFDSSGHMLGMTSAGGLNGGGTVFAMMPSLQFVPTTPCRVVDTRNPDGPFGGPSLSGRTSRSFPLGESGNPCNIPSNAIAYSLNVTVVPQGVLGYLTIWPTGQTQPLVSTLNSYDGRTKANAAIVPTGTPLGAVSVYVTHTTDVILDINGYFTAPGSQTMQFYPLPPCRVADTRDSSKPQGLGPPLLGAMETRRLPILTSPCLQNLPIRPQAYSFNVTVSPNPVNQPLYFLALWPSGPQPLVSTLNNDTATAVANAAIVPADPSTGDIEVYGSNSTDVIIDVNGYFAAPGTGGYSFYPVTPCRAFDSRDNNGPPFTGERTVPIASSPCAPPTTAAAYVFNATVVPSGALGYLTLWPDGGNQPYASTLNAYDGIVASNMAIVPNGDGSTDAYAAGGYTQLILDISGYFAQ